MIHGPVEGLQGVGNLTLCLLAHLLRNFDIPIVIDVLGFRFNLHLRGGWRNLHGIGDNQDLLGLRRCSRRCERSGGIRTVSTARSEKNEQENGK